MQRTIQTGPRLPKNPEQAWAALKLKGDLPKHWKQVVRDQGELIDKEFSMAISIIKAWVQRCTDRDQITYDLQVNVKCFEDGGVGHNACEVYHARLDPDDDKFNKACFYWRVLDRSTMQYVTRDLQHALRRFIFLPTALQGKTPPQSARRQLPDEPA